MKTPEEVFSKGVSPSMLSLWLLCKKRFYNKYFRELTSEPSAEMKFGTAFGNFLDTYHNESMPLLELDAYNVKFQSDFPEELRGKYVTQELGIRLIKHYIETYPKESESFKVLEGQREIIVNYQNGSGLGLIQVHAIPDAIIEYRGELWIREDKTGSSPVNAFRNDVQVYTYLYAVAEVMKRPVRGVLFNTISTKKNIDRNSFTRDDSVAMKSPEQVAYHMKQFYLQASEMIEFCKKNYKEPEKFLMSDSRSSCFAFFSECPYLTMCEMGDNIEFAEEII